MAGSVKYRLSDRPTWWLPKLMKWAALLSGTFGLLFYLAPLALEAFVVFVLNGDLSRNSGAIHFQYVAEAAFTGALGILFCATVFWMLSLAVDKIDQLVWLNATDEDRAEILAKRKKKRVKSPASEERA